MVWLEPADLSNQEKKSVQSDAGRKERADLRKADQKATKAKGKAIEPGLEVYTSSDMVTPVIGVYFPAGLMAVSIGASYPLQNELC